MDNKSPEAFRTISEVADWLGVPAHVLRFWESRFGQVKPVKRAGGRRYYRPSDMELLGGIRKLLHEDGMTIRGVQKLLRENGVRYVAAMSPPIDQPGDLRDVSPADDNAAERPRSAPVFDDEIEDAVEAEAPPEPVAQSETPDTATDTTLTDEPDTVPVADPEVEPEAPADSRPTPADASPVPDAIEPGTDAAMEEAVAEAVHTSTTDAPQAEAGDDRAPAVESVAQDMPPEAEAQDAAGQDAFAPDTVARETGETPLDDTLEALEFRSHEAQPDTSEGPEEHPEVAMDAGVPEATDHPTAAAAPPAPERDDDGPAEEIAEAADDVLPAGPADVPDAAQGTAPPAEQDTVQGATAEETPAAEANDAAEAARGDETPPAADVPEPDTAAAPPTPAAPPPVAPSPAPPQAPRPDLVLPDIGPDPEDDAVKEAAPALAAALRRGRPLTHRPATPARLNPALIQAYADRLQALSGRLGATPDGRRPF